MAGLLANQELIIHTTTDRPKRNNDFTGGEEGQTEEEERQKLSKYNIHAEQWRARKPHTCPQNNMQYPGQVLNTQTIEVHPFSQVLKRLLKLEGEACDIF